MIVTAETLDLKPGDKVVVFTDKFHPDNLFHDSLNDYYLETTCRRMQSMKGEILTVYEVVPHFRFIWVKGRSVPATHIDVSLLAKVVS